MRGIKAVEKRVAQYRGGGVWRAVETFSNLISFPLDEWQTSVIVLAIVEKGTWSISAMRKIGKTHLLGFLMLFLGSAGYTGLYTSHKSEFVKEFFEFVRPYAESLKEQGVVSRIEPSHGFLNIYFNNGGELRFRTRSKSLRGGMKLDFALWDEAQKMKASARDEVSGTMYTSPGLRLQIMVGNPATDEDYRLFPDSPFTKAKVEAHDKLIEFSALDQYSPEIRLTSELLRECNPNAGRIGDLDALIAEETKSKSHKVLAAELFGVWDLPSLEEKITPELSMEIVEKILTGRGSNASRFYLSVSIDYKSSEAFMIATDGTVMELAEVIPVERGSIEAVSEWILKNKARFTKISIMGTSRGKTLIESLKSIKVKIETVPQGEFAVRLNRFISQGAQGSLKVLETPEIRAALSTFWLSMDQRTGLPLPQASSPEMLSLVNSLLMAAIDDNAATRIANANSLAPKIETHSDIVPVEEEKPSKKPEAMDPMAAYKAMKAAKAKAAKEKK